MKKHILLIFFFVCGISAIAQNGLGFNQYILNSQLINPAYYNQRSPITVNLAGRYQWMDYPGAPNTIGLTGMYNINDHHTVGLTLSNDRVAKFNTFQASATYAYRLKLSDKVQLSFGAKVGFVNQASTIDLSSLNNPNDPTFYPQKSINGLTLGAGLFFSGQRFFVGISAPNLFNNGLMKRGFSSNLAGNAYYLSAGYKVVNTKPFMFYPSILISATEGAPIHGQFDLNFLIFNGVWINAGVSTEVATNIGIGYLFSNGFRIVYDYGFSFGKFNKYGSGIHEITLGYTKDLFQNEFAKRKYVNKKGSFQSYKKQHRRYK